jgi:hypothetical protein
LNQQRDPKPATGGRVEKQLFVPVGVVVGCEKVDHPWLSEQWRPVSVLMTPPPTAGWRELVRGERYVHYHAANVEVELHHKETAAYQVNLHNGSPAVYVVLRHDACPATGYPVTVHTATLSPFDAQAYAESGDETVEAVAMPASLVQLVRTFVATHHDEETFVKRKRNKAIREEPYQFGQESPVEVARRMQGRRQDREPNV